MRKLTAAAVAVTGLALLAGCAPGGAAAGDGSTDAVSKDLGDEPITIKVVSTPESGALAKAAIPGFEELHPNVSVEYAETSFDDYNTNLNLDLDSDTPPDVVLLNSVGNTIKNGLVRDLDDYAELYGWDEVYPDTQLAQWRVGEDGTTLGEGSLYAAPAGFSVVGVYYNKDLAEKVGLDEMPSDLESFESALTAAKDAGVLPIQLGNAGGHANFPVQLIGQSIDGPAAYAKWVFGHEGATFDTPGNTTGLETLEQWARSGFISPDANGTDLQTAVSKFVSGEGLFFVDGNWDAGAIDEGLGDKVGFIPFPTENVTGIGTSVAYAIASKSKNQDAAAAFLDYLNTPEAGVFQYDSGFIPVNDELVDPSGVRVEILDAFGKISDADGLTGFAAGATSTMNDTFTVVTQELIADRTTVADAIARVQADWETAHGN